MIYFCCDDRRRAEIEKSPKDVNGIDFVEVSEDQMVVALYPPCNDSCPQLVQGASVTVPFSAISGYTAASREAVVMWWKYVRRADGSLVPEGGMQSVNVRLD